MRAIAELPSAVSPGANRDQPEQNRPADSATGSAHGTHAAPTILARGRAATARRRTAAGPTTLTGRRASRSGDRTTGSAAPVVTRLTDACLAHVTHRARVAVVASRTIRLVDVGWALRPGTVAQLRSVAVPGGRAADCAGRMQGIAGACGGAPVALLGFCLLYTSPSPRD